MSVAKRTSVPLSPADRIYVRLLAGASSHEVLTALESRAQRWTDLSGGAKSPTLIRDLGRLALLAGEVLPLLIQRGGHGERADVIHCETAGHARELREDYYGLYLPGRVVDYVSADARIRGNLPRWWMVGVLFSLVPILLVERLGRPSQLSGRKVRLTRYCLAALSHALSTRDREAYMMRLYQPHVPILSALLRDHRVRVSIVTNAAPMAPSEFAIPADRLILSYPLQVDVALAWRGERVVDTLELWGPTRLPEMLRAYSLGRDRADVRYRTLGVYTQGFWLRLEEGTIAYATGARFALLESELMSAVAAVLDEDAELTVRVFPHPSERRHYLATGERPSWDVLDHPRVQNHYGEGGNSNQSFGLARVGVTTLSTVAYDRLYMGFPTLFYVGDVEFDMSRVGGSARDIVLRDPQDLRRMVSKVLDMPPSEFFERYFGGWLDEWQPSERQAQEMVDYAGAGREGATG